MFSQIDLNDIIIFMRDKGFNLDSGSLKPTGLEFKNDEISLTFNIRMIRNLPRCTCTIYLDEMDYEISSIARTVVGMVDGKIDKILKTNIRKEKCIKWHRKMWHWIADYINIVGLPDILKEEELYDISTVARVVRLKRKFLRKYSNEIKADGIEDTPSCGCFACAYSKNEDVVKCNCLFDWRNEKLLKSGIVTEEPVQCYESYYNNFQNAIKREDEVAAIKLARKIANLPVRR